MHLAAGDASVALAPLKRAAQLNPLPEYLWWLLEALRATGHDQEAHTVATQLRQQGALTDRRTLALYLATMGQESETAVQLAEAELASRTDVLTLDALAWALYAAGRGQEARHMSQRAATVGTQDARLFYHAGVIAAAVGKYDEARDWCARAEAIGQMLLPSERAHLAAASAAIPSPLPVLTWQLEPDTEHINDNSEGRRE
jgi:tetratricopeptide (TPR) repeat protein